MTGYSDTPTEPRYSNRCAPWFPPEIWIYILEHLDPIDHKTIVGTCIGLRDVAQTLLFRNVRIDVTDPVLNQNHAPAPSWLKPPFKASEEDLLAGTSIGERLHFYQTAEIVPLVRECAISMPFLSMANIELRSTESYNFSNLINLKIRGASFMSAGLKELRCLPHLQSLRVAHCDFEVEDLGLIPRIATCRLEVSDQYMRDCSNAWHLLVHPQAEYLVICSSELPPILILPAMARLRSVHLIADSPFAPWIPIFSSCPALEAVYIELRPRLFDEEAYNADAVLIQSTLHVPYHGPKKLIHLFAGADLVDVTLHAHPYATRRD
jgi:hypothetical protein